MKGLEAGFPRSLDSQRQPVWMVLFTAGSLLLASRTWYPYPSPSGSFLLSAISKRRESGNLHDAFCVSGKLPGEFIRLSLNQMLRHRIIREKRSVGRGR